MNYSDMIEKAKYISRKRVGNKYVYKYADDKKGQSRPGGSGRLSRIVSNFKVSREKLNDTYSGFGVLGLPQLIEDTFRFTEKVVSGKETNSSYIKDLIERNEEVIQKLNKVQKNPDFNNSLTLSRHKGLVEEINELLTDMVR